MASTTANTPKTRLWQTQNDLPEEVRVGAIGLLNQQLADALDLDLQAKQAHWNVKGPLFDEVEEELEEFADDIAERAVVLGGTAFGTVRVAAGKSRLPEYPLDIISGREHVTALSSALARFARSARAAIESANTLGDADTADLFTEVSRGVDKLLWKVEAHAQAND
jgi:starvation-inducible DNA-binding protein